MYVELLEKDAQIHVMKELGQLKNGIILRHDLDSEMDSALIVAQMEHRLGIKASYYFLLTSRSYNLYSKHSQKIVHEVMNLGHEVGLHFDVSIYPEEEIQKAFQKEKRILEFLTEQKVRSMSLHNPTQNGSYPSFDGVVNAYNWDLFSPKTYFSDSGFGFKATVDEIVGEAERNIVQLLLHPTLYCIRNEDEAPGVIYISKIEIERFANRLIAPIVVHPLFKDEIECYQESNLNISVKLKD